MGEVKVLSGVVELRSASLRSDSTHTWFVLIGCNDRPSAKDWPHVEGWVLKMDDEPRIFPAEQSALMKYVGTSVFIEGIIHPRQSYKILVTRVIPATQYSPLS